MLFFPLQKSPFLGDWKPRPEVAHRTLPMEREARQRLASQICVLPFPNAEQMATLKALGHDALPALINAFRRSEPRHRHPYATLIFLSAKPEDTPALYGLRSLREVEKFPAPFLTETNYSTIEYWLSERGDAAFLAPIVFPRYKAGKSGDASYRDLTILLRSHRDDVIDYLFAMLKDEKTDPWMRKRLAYGIAQCERPDVLQWLRDSVLTSRTRSIPNAEMSSQADADADGLPDDVDRNPFAAPRDLTEEERVVQVAYASSLRFSKSSSAKVGVFYPNGMKPFELYGLDGTIVPMSRGIYNFHLPPTPSRFHQDAFISLQLLPYSENDSFVFGPLPEDGVRLAPNAEYARVDIHVTGRDNGATSYRATLKKIAGQWYVIRYDTFPTL